jgi:hypothetical protein
MICIQDNSGKKPSFGFLLNIKSENSLSFGFVYYERDCFQNVFYLEIY